MGGCLAVQLSCDQALSQACSCCFGDGNYIHTMKSNLESLEKTMQELKERRDDLSRRVSIEEDKGFQRFAQVQGWLSRVQDIEYQVSDLLETKSNESQQLCLFGYCSNKCISSCAYGKKVSKKLKEVQELLSKGAFDVLVEEAHVQKVVKQHIKTTFGLDSMVEKTWNILKNPEVTTLGLYGMGGVGKTTLLARINNKFIEEVNESDIVIWVVVSKDLEIQGIQNHILRRLRPDKKWKQVTTEEDKASSIYNILSRKKFVLLLDDLWDEVDLNKIGVPPLDNGSKLVFTTRSKEVCRAMKPDVEMQVECLSNDEAWELFRNTVGENVLKRHQNIPTLAREVAEKCCGLPLALTVIGKAMASKENVHEWGYALRLLNSYNHTFPGMEEKIFSILKFSYDGLGDKNVKSCFLYCSLFPKDYEIEKEKLIEYWICEGLINGHREEDGSSSQGHAIIGSLVRAQLLMEVYGESSEKVKMHDVLREMALWITSDYVKSGVQLRDIPNDIEWEVVRRICLMCNQIEEIFCSPYCPNLSTLLLGYNRLMGISGEFFRFMSALVILDLSWNHSLKRLPTEISTLSSLKYLNISYTGIFRLAPIGLKELNKLISLDIEGTAIENIDGIGRSLPNLQVLKLYGSEVSINDSSMEELQLLEHLEILTADVYTARDLKRIQGVKRLANCIRVLCLKKIVEDVVVLLDTAALGGLQRLVIMHCKISEIKIDCERSKERGILYPNYPGFKHLTTVQINDLDGPTDLTWLLFAQNLRALTVWSSVSIEEIIHEEETMRRRKMHAPLAKLEYLSLYDLSELKRISWRPLAIPNLKEFVVDTCPNLPKAATEFPKHA